MGTTAEGTTSTALFLGTSQFLPKVCSTSGPGVSQAFMNLLTLISVSGSNGYRNLAADLFKLSEVMQSNWEAISNRTSMTQAELSHMGNVADQIYQALGMREQRHELQASAGRDRGSVAAPRCKVPRARSQAAQPFASTCLA